MLRKLTIALIAGIVFTLLIIQDDPWIKHIVGQGFKLAFESAGNCKIYFTVQRIGIFSPFLELSDVRVMPIEGDDWQWNAKTYTTRSNWLHLLLYGVVDMDVTFDQFQGRSKMIDGRCMIHDHIDRLVNAPAVYAPTFLKSLTFTHGSCSLVDEARDIHIFFAWHSDAKKIEQSLQANISFLDGMIRKGHKIYGKAFSGDCHIELQKQGVHPYDMVVRGACTFELPDLPDVIKTCYLTGFWEHDHGIWKVKHANHLLLIDPITLNTIDQKVILSLRASMPAQFVWDICPYNAHHTIKGHVLSHILANVSDLGQGIHGYILLQDIAYEQHALFQSLRLSFGKTKETWRGALDISRSFLSDIHGSWQWNSNIAQGYVRVQNESTIEFPSMPYWHIEPSHATLQLDIKNNMDISGIYQAQIVNSRAKVTQNIQGTIETQDQDLLIDGSYNSYVFKVHIPYDDIPHVKRAELYDMQGNPLAQLSQTRQEEDHQLYAAIQFSFLRMIAQQYWGYYLQGTGSLILRGSYRWPTGTIHMYLADGVIRLPETYNFLQSFSCNLYADMNTRTVQLSDCVCQLHKGTLNMPHASLCFDTDGSLHFIHVPLTIEHCLCNVQKDLFTQISGFFLLEKRTLQACTWLKGHLFLDRGQLVENMLFDRFIAKVRSRTESLIPSHMPQLHMQLTLETKEPLRIRTAFLETDATMQASVQGTIENPDISGMIQFHAGKLLFPYRPLYITQGYIEFQKQNLFDPHIVLYAQNQIKSHAVSLQVTGSLQRNHIMLDSVPHLAEEQIVSLLLVGSTQESLNVVMPALVVQNIGSLLFSSQKSSLHVSQSLGKLLQPLRHIRLVPHFTDQTGRGGLRGAIEIDLSDRWRALIQKNFSLTEDTRFELSYDVSDDMSIRMYRDERRDIAAEVEMRWKW